jgi:site-specific recombinase XerD
LERETGFEPATSSLGRTLSGFKSKGQQNHLGENITSKSNNTAISLESVAKGYLLNCRCENKSPKTLHKYEEIIAHFIWLARRSGFPNQIDKITVNEVREFLYYLASEKNRWDSDNHAARKMVSSATVGTYYRALRTFFNWLYREEIITDNPFSNLRPPKVMRKIVQALTSDEVARLLDTASGKTAFDFRNRAILSVFLDSGLRVGELANLRIEDVDKETGSILVRNGKGGKQRVVRIGNTAQKILWKYLAIYRHSDSNFLFVNRLREPLDIPGFKILVRRLGIKAGVKVHPHQLRHTFAINFLRAGGDVFSLQYLLGHSTLAMTQRYLQSLNVDDAMKAHKRFSPLDNLREN